MFKMVKNENPKSKSREQLGKMLERAVVFVEHDKDYKGIYFDDKGLKLEVTSDFAVISTMSHRHVFNKVTSNGISRPYLYVEKMIEFAESVDCIVKDKDGNITRSYSKMMHELQQKSGGNSTEYNIVWYVDKWLYNIFQPLYTIDETEAGAFFVYFDYLGGIAKNAIILEEKKEDLTNKGFIEKFIGYVKDFTDNLTENVIFKKKTDDEKIKEEVEAMGLNESEEILGSMEGDKEK